ncbi:MAG TPA: DUF805 domain-containing protein [Asticcacaulis sp.]|nr:DUF805 domain-containing protein [Asticcacaulis sp.]
MGSFSLWHLLIILIVALPLMIVPLIVVLTLPKPQGENRFGLPAQPAASGQAIIRGLKNYFVFTGRASRSEYWWFLFWVFLTYLTVYAVTYKITEIENTLGGLTMVLQFVPILFYIPLLSAGVRRLQDANRSGLWIFLAFGGFTVIALLILLAEPARGDID